MGHHYLATASSASDSILSVPSKYNHIASLALYMPGKQVFGIKPCVNVLKCSFQVSIR